MPRSFPEFRRGTPEYDEVTRILGPRCIWVLDEGVRQINRRWLKVDYFIKGADGQHVYDEGTKTMPTRSRRIRIPHTSFLARA